MTPAGWVVLLFSWGSIIGLALFCFRSMMKSGKL